MHISLEKFNLLLDQKIADDDRIHLMDHLLSCDACADKFRVLNGLHQELGAGAQAAPKPAARRRAPVRYILGAAAVLVMAITPYLFKGQQGKDQLLVTRQTPAIPAAAPSDISILNEIKQVNYQSAVTGWNKDSSLIDLVAIRNQLKGG